jgi:hypothetical protein
MMLVLAAALFLPHSGHASGWVTTILSVDTATAVYGGTVSVRATLTDADTGAGIPGKLISFLVNGQFRQAVTNAAGVAEIGNLALGRVAAGAHPGTLLARFDGVYGATVYEASSGAGDLQVAKRPLRVIPEAVSRQYGDENPAALPYRLENFASGDDERVLAARPSCTTTATRVSSVGAYPITCDGLAADNYEGDYSAPGVLTVTPAPMTIRPHDQVKPLGQTAGPLTATYIGTWKLGEGPWALSGTLKCGSAGASRWAGAGAYLITCTGQSSTNYALKYAEGTLQVVPTAAPGLLLR